MVELPVSKMTPLAAMLAECDDTAPMSEDDYSAKETLEFWANAVLPGDIG